MQQSKRNLSSSLMMKLGVVLTLTVLTLLVATQQALAHHPFGGNTPSNVVEAFLSGMGHPIIGVDDFAFVVASGLLAVQLRFPVMRFLGFIISGVGIVFLGTSLVG
jgi:urease accessory protein